MNFKYHCAFCGKVAFELKKRPRPDEPLRLKDLIVTQMAKPRAGDEIICQYCKEPVFSLFINNLDL